MIGYCCINMTLAKEKVKVNRGMIKRTFLSKGLDYVSELILLNLDDTLKILKWNIDNDILLYRLSSDSFPWMSEYNFEDLPNFELIKTKLENIGKFIMDNNMRCGYHPGPYSVLASLNPRVVENTIKDLNKHAEILDLMNLPKNHYYSINIHVNVTKPDKEESMKRFCDNFQKLSDSCRKRLTIENDDFANQYSVKDLYNGLYKNIKIPIVFDQFHFLHGPQDQDMKSALELALSTWGDIKPLTHMSSSKLLESNDNKIKNNAHSDFIYERIESFGNDFDTELECKKKELAVLKYKKDFM
jgi:UV DNA damage endonuclease